VEAAGGIIWITQLANPGTLLQKFADTPDVRVQSLDVFYRGRGFCRRAARLPFNSLTLVYKPVLCAESILALPVFMRPDFTINL
jgi:hypothetical protein